MPPLRPAALLPLALAASLLTAPALARQLASPAATLVANPVAPPVAVAPLPLEGERREVFASFVEEAVAELGVPGAAVAVVQGGGVVFLEGYGVREADGGAPVGPDTLFEIGSITKPFTSALAATLVDDGLLSWDTPAADLLPGLAADPALAERLTLENLLCACSGLPSEDERVFYNADGLDPTATVALLAAQTPTAAPGERFQYSNLAYAGGGYAVAAAAGAAPDALAEGYRLALRDRLLGPVGMPRSSFDLAAVLADGDYAAPHGIDLDGRNVPLPLLQAQRLLEPLDPAAGLWSSAREQAAWLQTLVAGGIAPDGSRVLSPERLAEVWQQRVALHAAEGAAIPVAAGYGVGWFVGEAAGHRLVSHSGSTPGFQAQLTLLPDAGLGAVVLTNGGGGGALAFLAQQRLVELLLGEPPTAEATLAQAVAADRSTLAGYRAQLGGLDPPAVAPFLGRYANPELGGAELRLQNGRLVFDAGEIRSELRPLRLRPDPDIRYAFVSPGAINPFGQLIPRRDADGGLELVLTSLLPALPTDPAGEPPPDVIFTHVDGPSATPVAAATPSP